MGHRINKSIGAILRRFGYEIRKVPHTQDPEIPEHVVRSLNDLHAILAPLINENAISEESDASRDAMRYLCAPRVRFYHQLLDLLDQEVDTRSCQSLMDVGTGYGALLRILMQRHANWRLVGLDAKAKDAGIARLLCPSADIKVSSMWDMESSALYDVVLAIEVLEHMVEPERALRQCLALRSPRGCVVVTVPDGRKDSLRAGEYYPEAQSYWGHINFWSPESWREFIVRNSECGIVKTGCFGGDSLFAVIACPGAGEKVNGEIL